MHKIYASGTILYRGSTLLAVLIVQPLILMIQGDVLKVEKIKDPVFVASKNFFNQSGEIIGCPILGESTESPLHIYVEMDENKGYIQCEQMKMLDLRVRGYKIIDRVKMADVINVTDAIQSIFDYI